MLATIIQNIFTKTYEEIFNTGVRCGTENERNRQLNERKEINRFKNEYLISKKVIVISNEWEDPMIGIVLGFEDFNRNECHPIIENAITNEVVVSFGKIVPYSSEILQSLVGMSPWARWEMLTGQKIKRNPPTDVKLSTYDELMQQLEDNRFFDFQEKMKERLKEYEVENNVE